MNTTARADVERRSLSADELAVGLRILADLVEAGLPLTRALHAFSAVAPRAWRDAAPAITDAVREGRGLARALEESGLELPAIVTGLVRAGEAGSGLATALRRAADHAESMAAARAAVQGALAYPAIVAVVGLGTVAVMVGVVLPRFARVLADLQQTLPPTTQLVLGTAQWLRAWGLVLTIGLIVVALLFEAARRHPDGRRVIHRTLLGVPGIGEIRFASATARFTATLAALLECGIALRVGLRHATDAVGDDEIAARLIAARARVDAGGTLGLSLDELAVVTPLAARLVAAGEESGRLPGMLAYAARLEQARAERLTRAGVRLIEPGLILAFAAIVGLVATAMLQAVYAVRPG